MSHDTTLESLFKPHLIITYTISGTKSKKKTRTKAQVKDIKLRFLRTYYSHLNRSIAAVFYKTK